MSFAGSELGVQGNPNQGSHPEGTAHLPMRRPGPSETPRPKSGAEDDFDLVAKLRKKLARARSKVLDWRNMAFSDRRFYDGHQWSGYELRLMRDQQRPDINFNRIRPVIKVIVGFERLNRTEMRYVSPHLDSTLQEDMRDDLATWSVREMFDRCEADPERSEAIEDAAVVGMGWTQFVFDSEKDEDGRIEENRVPWKEMLWDVDSIKRNLEDATWFARERWLSNETIRARWPEKADLITLAASELDEGRPSTWEQVTPWFSAANVEANQAIGTHSGSRRSGCLVTQIQWSERQQVVRFVDPRTGPNGAVQELPLERYRVLLPRLKTLGIPEPISTRRTKLVWRQAYLAKQLLLEQAELPHGPTFLCMTCEWDEESLAWRGLVRHLVDPQKLANKAISQSMHIYNTNAKGGVLYESDAFVDAARAERDWSQPNAFIQMAPGGSKKIVDRSRQAAQMPAFLPEFVAFAVRGFQEVSGINLDVLGTSQGDVPTTTVRARQAQAFLVLGDFFDAVARFRRREAHLALEFVRSYGPYGRPVRIGGAFSDHAVPLLPQLLPSKVDVVVDESAYRNPNLRAQVWADLQPMIPALLRFGAGAFLLRALRFSPLPAQLVAELEQVAKQTPPPGRAQRGKPENPQLTAAKVQKMGADAQKSLAQARALDTERGVRALEAGIEAVATVHRHHEDHETQAMNRAKNLASIVKDVLGGTGNAPPPQG